MSVSVNTAMPMVWPGMLMTKPSVDINATTQP